jgi:hypothetical protein
MILFGQIHLQTSTNKTTAALEWQWKGAIAMVSDIFAPMGMTMRPLTQPVRSKEVANEEMMTTHRKVSFLILKGSAWIIGKQLYFYFCLGL